MLLNPSDIRNILIIKLRAIGDVVLSTPVLENLRSAFPESTIDFLVESNSHDVLSGNPYLSTILVFEPKRQNGIGLIRKVRGRNYDLVIDLFGNPRSALVTLASGARYRLGYRFGWRRLCYNIVVEPRGGEVHNVEFNLDALRRIGVPVIRSTPFFPLLQASENFADEFFSRSGLKSKPVIAFNPGGGWYTKRWRPQQFAKLGRLIVDRLGKRILVMWGPGELEDARQIASGIGQEAILAPPSSLSQFASLMKRCSMVVTNDSGPMHIAASVGIPIVAIFGPTRPEFQGPVGTTAVIVRNSELTCLGCNLTKCPIGNPCMEELTAERVYEAVASVMEKI